MAAPARIHESREGSIVLKQFTGNSDTRSGSRTIAPVCTLRLVPLFTAGLAFAALLSAPAPRAYAQGLFNGAFLAQPSYRPVVHKKRKPVRRTYRRSTKPKLPKLTKKPEWFPDETAKDPAQIIVSLSEQKARIYQGTKLLTTSRVSSGKKGYDTPTGVFSILNKKRWHRSNIYSGAPMPFMQRLTWSGIALHASNSVPNRPASHGCVRLPNSFAPQLFQFTKRGIHVVITEKKDLAPQPVHHDALFAPRYPAPKDYDLLESERVLMAAGVKPEKRAARETAPLRILITRRTGRERLMDVQRLLNELDFGAGDVDGWMGPDTARAIRRFQKTYGEAYGLANDGLVTDALLEALYRAAGRPAPENGHIYVRQNFRQVFDAPVTILKPEIPLGYHLITAQHFEPGQEDVRWLYVTLGDMQGEPQREASLRDPTKTTDTPGHETPVQLPSSDVREALDRIVIPQEVRVRIGKMLTPGSSLAISDSGLSKETHPKGTDFIVLTRH